ncbi:hypothetical protein [uncultured Bacteroides sp.]|nr:hypothetical protein [uncultured Bacteroides sp.]
MEKQWIGIEEASENNSYLYKNRENRFIFQAYCQNAHPFNQKA